MNSSRILVFTTTYMEAGNIGRLIDQIASYLPQADILVIDDSSPDQTWEEIQSRLPQYPQLRAIQRKKKFGIGSAHKYALIYAMRHSYKTLITMDADFSHDPATLPELMRAHRAGGFVTGSRYCAGGSSSYTGYRNILSRVGNICARIVLGVKLRELTTYYRVFDVSSLRRLPLRHVSANGYSYGVQLIACLHAAKLEMVEVPIRFQDRAHGRSKIPKLQILISALDLLKLAFVRVMHIESNTPDLPTEDPCRFCNDNALTMTPRFTRVAKQSGLPTVISFGGKRPIYICLACMREQVPSSLTVSQASGSSNVPE